MAVPKLKKWLPDRWYERQRRYVSHYINYAGQIVKHIKRSDRVYDFYRDLVSSEVAVTNIKAMIVRDPLGIPFMGKVLGQYEEEVELSGYFKREDNVETGDLIVIELKSLEGELDRDLYEVVLTRTWLYEQETMRKFKMFPLRDGELTKLYEDEAIDENPPDHEGYPHGSLEIEANDIMKHPGGFSETYYGGFIDPDIDIKMYPFPNKTVIVPEETPEVLREEAGVVAESAVDTDIADEELDEKEYPAEPALGYKRKKNVSKEDKKPKKKPVRNPFTEPIY